LTDKKFRKGDKVEWQSHGTTVTGTVQREITSDTRAAGRRRDRHRVAVFVDELGARHESDLTPAPAGSAVTRGRSR
jgi:hypothetical protein